MLDIILMVLAVSSYIHIFLALLILCSITCLMSVPSRICIYKWGFGFENVTLSSEYAAFNAQ